MKILLHLVHALPLYRGAYEAALRARGIEADVVTVLPSAAAGGALSSAYADLARLWGMDGLTVAEGLMQDYPPPATGYGARFIASWSAGYKLLEHALAGHDAEAFAGAILLDSGHAALDPDGTASDKQIEPFVRLARRAMAGEALFWLGHTDVQTPQTGPGAFASTTQFAAELLRLAAPEIRPPVAPAHVDRGLLRIQAFDLEPPEGAKQEHLRAVAGWGADLVGDAIAAWIRARSLVDSLAGVSLDKVRAGVEQGAEGLGGAGL